jgi:DNA-binding NtrC family response regulator
MPAMPPLSTDRAPRLLAIIELGGYPNFSALYRRLGFDVEMVSSQRKAQAALKRRLPDVIVAEYNFQSDFRDRTSNLETLMARLQRHPQVRVIAIYQPEHEHKLDQLRQRFPLFASLPLPVTEPIMERALERALAEPREIP